MYVDFRVMRRLCHTRMNFWTVNPTLRSGIYDLTFKALRLFLSKFFSAHIWDTLWHLLTHSCTHFTLIHFALLHSTHSLHSYTQYTLHRLYTYYFTHTFSWCSWLTSLLLYTYMHTHYILIHAQWRTFTFWGVGGWSHIWRWDFSHTHMHTHTHRHTIHHTHTRARASELGTVYFNEVS